MHHRGKKCPTESIRPNTYVGTFIDIHKIYQFKATPVDVAEKRRVAITLPFEAGHLFNWINQNLMYWMKLTYLSTELNILHTTKELNIEGQLMKVFGSNSSHIISQLRWNDHRKNGSITQSTHGGACTWAVSEIICSLFARTKSKYEKSSLDDGEASYGLCSPNWPRPSVPSDSTEPQP